MGIFDIIGPIMVGPSSSHTAGAARIGQTTRAILGEDVKKATVTLYGSFAKTGKGHGTDRALVSGLMGYAPDSVTIRDAINIAKERGVEISFFLSEDEMCVVMPKGYPLEENREVPMKLLADYPLVLYRDDFNLHDDILTNCKKIGFTPKVAFETSQRELMLQTVASGLGVAILPSRLCPENSEDSKVVTRAMTEPRMTHHLYAIWKKGRFLSRAARLWIEFTKDHLTLLDEDKKIMNNEK